MPDGFFKWLLSNRLANPVLGMLIRLLAATGCYGPLVALSRRYVSGERGLPEQLTLLALLPDRFRGDLGALGAGGVNILRLDPAWMYRLMHSFYRLDLKTETPVCFKGHPDVRPGDQRLAGFLFAFEAAFLRREEPRILAHHRRLEAFMRRFLPRLLSGLGVDAVISPCAQYVVPYLWGSNADASGTPFVILHRECLHSSPHRRRFWIDMWSRVPEFRASGIIVHNEIARQTFVRGGLLPPERIMATGALRMDDYVARARAARGTFPQRPRLVLFSFTHGMSIGMTSPHWSRAEERIGFVRQFELTHGAFARFAARNPGVDCIVKLKWTGDGWDDRVIQAARGLGVDAAALPNLRITVDDNPHQLILDSSGVIGFGSTTLVEAALAGRPVILPLLGEAQEPEFKEKVLMLEEAENFTCCRSLEEYEQALHRAIADPSSMLLDARQADRLFERWIAPVDGTAVPRTIAAIRQLAGVRETDGRTLEAAAE